MRILVADPLCIAPFYDRYLCEALTGRGHNLELWIREPDLLPRYFENSGFHVKKLSRVSKTLFSANSIPAKIVKYIELLLIDFPRMLLAARRADIVHVQWLSPPPFANFDLLLWKLVKFLGKKVVFTAHNLFPHEAEHKPTNHLRRVYRLFDRLIVTTRYAEKLLSEFFPAQSHKVAVIPHGPFFHDVAKVGGGEARKHLNISPSGKLILFQGYFSSYKGVEFLIDSFATVVKNYPDIILILAGGGNQDYQKKLDDVIMNLQIPPERVVRAYRFIPLAELPFYYEAADIVVFPYKDIYQSGALFTALAFGKPIIATTVGGLPEVIKDNINGRLVKYGDTILLAKTMVELLQSPEKCTMLGTHALKMVTEDYSWSMIAEKTEAVYMNLLQSQKS